MSRRFLMVSPFFVPMNYVGAKRSLHLARHLPEFGWEPAVYCMPEEFEQDPALLDLVPPCPIERGFRDGPLARWQDARKAAARAAQSGVTSHYQTKENQSAPAKTGLWTHPLQTVKGLVSPFDRFTVFVPGSILRARRFLKANHCEAIYANAGPFSAIFLAEALARLSGLPLILDLRDPWTIEPNYRAEWTPGGQAVMDHLEARAFGRASRVILNTRAARDAYIETYAGRLPESLFTFVRNQFDPELYGPPSPAPGPEDPFRIIYYGHLRPAKNAALFLEGFRRFIDHHELTPSQVEFITLGHVTASDAEIMDALGLSAYVQQHPWLPFTDSPSLLGTASLLLDLMGPNHALQISGKIYDYLAAGRPILSVSPCTELDGIFSETGAGERVALDVTAITAALERALTNHRNGRPFERDEAAVSRYTARPAAESIGAILDEATKAND